MAERTKGDELAVSHPEKVLFPESGITKGEVCAYYREMAPSIVPHISGRPVTMERYPAGIGKKGFIQKDVSKGFPEWLERVEVEHRGRDKEKDAGPVHYPLVKDARSLVWLANQNSITPHVWTSRVPDLQRPDMCVFDLDPSRDDDADQLRAGAVAVRDVLVELGLPSFVKTSGSKGFHIVVSLAGSDDFELPWRFAQGVGAVLVKRHPDIFTQEFIKADRAGRIFVDTGRNAPGATCAAVYAVRPRPGAPVSAPCTWDEVGSGTVGPRSFTVRTMAARMAAVGELWRELERTPQSLRAPMEALEALMTPDDWREAQAAMTRRPTSRKAAPRGRGRAAKRND